MRLPVFLMITIAATAPALAHPGNHAHPHGGETVGLGLALLMLVATAAAAGLPHLLYRVRRRGDRD